MFDLKEVTMFSVEDLKDAKADEREEIINLLIKEYSKRQWSIQTPDTVFNFLLDVIKKKR